MIVSTHSQWQRKLHGSSLYLYENNVGNEDRSAVCTSWNGPPFKGNVLLMTLDTWHYKLIMGMKARMVDDPANKITQSLYVCTGESKQGGRRSDSECDHLRASYRAVASGQPRNEETQKNLGDKDTYGKGSRATEVTTSSAEFGLFFAVLCEMGETVDSELAMVMDRDNKGDSSGPNQALGFYSVSLHDENGQRQDILDSSVVQSDKKCGNGGQDKALATVIKFRWVFCQFAWLFVSIRPLRVEEFAKVLAILIDTGEVHVDWRLVQCISKGILAFCRGAVMGSDSEELMLPAGILPVKYSQQRNADRPKLN
ncbi:hypothetical protein EDB85DRAFT_2277120 [Lactarius pseudohatsudake]|nr:hypothetical protein EDB85DRAFT_2277120 [Lactarius pseudohatsudake]